MAEVEPYTARQPVVGVYPRAAREQRGRLFDTLEQALDVRFAGWDHGDDRGLSGAIVFGGRLSLLPAAAPSMPRLTIAGDVESGGDSHRVRLHHEGALDPRLRGWELSEAGARSLLDAAPAPGEQVIASESGRALWVVDRNRHTQQRVTVAPAELEEGEALRDRLCDGRFLALLPILELARRVASPRRWQSPPLRACFLFDDPNLHWPSYGHLRFGELARDARRHGYHVAVATVPIDAWLVHPRARSTFGHHPEALSLIVHGNDHVRRELARARTTEDAVALARQALARTSALERRARLPVGRIMAPPHGVCSEQMAAALLRAGFEAITVSRAYPWLEQPPADRPLAGWWPAEFVAGGIPVIERRLLGTPPGELALLAYLDHPVVLFGHHQDVAEGPPRLRRIREQLAGMGPIRWESIQRLARSNFFFRLEGERLHLRVHSRRVDLEVPPGVRELVVDLSGHPCPDEELVLCAGQPVAPGEPAPVRAGVRCEVTLRHALDGEPPRGGRGGRRRLKVWPHVRRGMSEARDRSLPMVARVAARGPGPRDVRM